MKEVATEAVEMAEVKVAAETVVAARREVMEEAVKAVGKAAAARAEGKEEVGKEEGRAVAVKAGAGVGAERAAVREAVREFGIEFLNQTSMFQNFAKSVGYSKNEGETAANLHLRIGYRF